MANAKQEPKVYRVRDDYGRVRKAGLSITAAISPDADAVIKQLAKERQTTRADVARDALTSYFQNLGYESQFVHEDVDGERLAPRIKVRSVKQVLFHSRCLIQAFEEALNYDAMRQHNEPPPALRLEDPEYLAELRNIVQELKQLNEFLSDLKGKMKGSPRSTSALQKHLNTFLSKYAATLGCGAGVMTLGVVASLLYQLGAGEVVFDHVLKKLPSR